MALMVLSSLCSRDAHQAQTREFCEDDRNDEAYDGDKKYIR